MTRHVLVADIGGTNTRIALAQDGALRPDSIKRFRNAEHSGLDHALERYTASTEMPALDGICVDIAGPVEAGAGQLTNLDWTLREDLLCTWSGAGRAALINDLQAQGYGAGLVPADKLRRIAPGAEKPATNTALIVNVGTGFNAVVVHDGPDGTHVPPAEAGHGALPVDSEADLRLCQMIQADYGFAAVEDVLSGRGLERVYRWVTIEAGQPDKLTAPDILASADAAPDGLAAQATAVFARYLGRVSGDLALAHLPFGGIYLVGGLAVALAPKLEALGFTDALRGKGRFSKLVSRIAVSAVEDDYAALRGAANYMDAHLRRDV